MSLANALYEIWKLISVASPDLLSDVVSLVRDALSGDQDKAARRAKATASRAASEIAIREALKRT